METVTDLIETTEFFMFCASVEFKLYCAAVKMAEKASGGSGELNIYDHVARDLHEPGFDEEFEKMTENFVLSCMVKFKPEVLELASKYEKG